jgi:hypothetical protein|tara:strand:+ start:512 stop:643 length:132 start_codon:yes stop_codon:yes gene_type:complete
MLSLGLKIQSMLTQAARLASVVVEWSAINDTWSNETRRWQDIS